MAVSVFQLEESAGRAATLDSQSGSTNYGGTFMVGLIYIGITKAQLRRAIASFNVLGTPFSGHPLSSLVTVTAAQLDVTVAALTGLSSRPSTVRRVTRYDWVTAEATWLQYKSGSNWTNAGGDFSTPNVGFTGPAANGAFTITGLASFVTDAIASRSGIVNLHIQLNNEVDDGNNRFYQFYPLSDMKLSVTYTASLMARPHGYRVSLDQGPRRWHGRNR